MKDAAKNSLKCVLRCTLALAWLGNATTAHCASNDAALGRLFLTPERRAALEALRQANVQVQTKPSETDNEPAPVVEVPSVSLDGIVLRSQGRATLWMNGRPLADRQTDGNLTLHANPQHPGAARLRSGDNSAEVQVGQSLNRSNLEATDLVPAGAIAVGRLPAR